MGDVRVQAAWAARWHGLRAAESGRKHRDAGIERYAAACERTARDFFDRAERLERAAGSGRAGRCVVCGGIGVAGYAVTALGAAIVPCYRCKGRS